MGTTRNVTTIDEKYRVQIGREAADAAGDRLVVIPFKGRIILETAEGKKFSESLPGFAFDESEHEADRYLKRLTNSA